MLEPIQQYVEGLAAWIQTLAVLVIGGIPFLESNVASAVGVLAGIPWFVAVPLGVLGNLTVSTAAVLGAARAHEKYVAVHGHPRRRPETPRHRRAVELFEKYGVIGAVLLGQVLLSGILTAAVLAGIGIERRRVLLCCVVSSVFWGLVFGLLTAAGIRPLS